MKLYYSTSSPFVRKVRITAREKGLLSRIDEIECNPFKDPPELIQNSPLGKVPALVTGDGLSLYDSPVICEFLDQLNAETEFYPRTDEARWVVARAHALADGILDAAVLRIVEGRRGPNEQSPSWIHRWESQFQRGIAQMENQLPNLPENITIAHIAFASVLGYLDFRYPDIGWQKDYVNLADWYAVFSQRPSMQETVHSDHSFRL